MSVVVDSSKTGAKLVINLNLKSLRSVLQFKRGKNGMMPNEKQINQTVTRNDPNESGERNWQPFGMTKPFKFVLVLGWLCIQNVVEGWQSD